MNRVRRPAVPTPSASCRWSDRAAPLRRSQAPGRVGHAALARRARPRRRPRPGAGGDGRTAAGLRVLDPACGDGRFLAAAAARIDRRFGAGSGRDRRGVGRDRARRRRPRPRRARGSARRPRSWSATPSASVHRRARSTSSSATRRSSTSWPRATTRRGRSRARRRPLRRRRRGVPGPGPPPGPARRRARRARPAPVACSRSRDAADVRRRGRSALGRLDGVVVVGRRDGVRRRRSTPWPPPSCSASASGPVRRWRGQACHELAPRRRHRARPAADVVAPAGRRRRDPCRRRPAPTACSPTGPPPRPASATSSTACPVRRETGRRDAPLVTSGLLDPGRCGVGGASGPLRRPPLPPPGRRPGRPRRRRRRGSRRGPRLAGCPRCCWPPRPPSWRPRSTSRAPGCRACPWSRWSPAPRHDLWPVGAVLCSPVTSAWAAATYLGAGLGPATIKLQRGPDPDHPLAGGPARRRRRRSCGPATSTARRVASTRAYGLRGDRGRGACSPGGEPRVSAARRRSARASGC